MKIKETKYTKIFGNGDLTTVLHLLEKHSIDDLDVVDLEFEVPDQNVLNSSTLNTFIIRAFDTKLSFCFEIHSGRYVFSGGTLTHNGEVIMYEYDKLNEALSVLSDLLQVSDKYIAFLQRNFSDRSLG
ncbi:hypothetical protein [Cytobacillus sp. IB215665]|uniref:hypothetical protein n=1 Tax=Cytobacillus sp. IB215665 TaxID=3097357 RepID=UPI002A11A224|nr:hypothetical protein [Cytobacillus sp. IB215665]MDX8367806.1 hypothetical protein [Cytobacillus sp. IB215665]